MPMTLDELRARLSDIEPTERTFADITPDDVPQLRKLLDDNEAWLAARAVYALGRINTPDAQTVVMEAARSPRPEVRVAVAMNAPRLEPGHSDQVLDILLDDSDLGVRKYAIQAFSQRTDPRLKAKLESIVGSDPNDTLRRIARERLRELR